MASHDRTMNLSEYHPFKSGEAREQYLKRYDAAASKWPIASETKIVDTSYGQTLVRISGPEAAPALILLPGGSGSSLSWMPHIAALSRDYRTYAVDNIYDFGRSVYTRDMTGYHDFVCWLDELFNALNLGKDINLMGLSFGAQLTAEYALRYPERLRRIVMLAPAAVVQPVSPAFNIRIMLCLIPHRYFMNSFYSWLFRDLIRKDEAGRKQAEEIRDESVIGTRCFKAKRIIQPRVFTDSELRGIKVPALYLVGENEKICSPRKAVGRLSKVAPQIQAEIILGAGHDLVFAQKDLVVEKALEFLRQQ